MTLEELSVVFSADVQPFSQAVQAVQGMVGEAVQAVDGMAAAFYQAGIRAAHGLRQGLLAGKGGVVQAAAQLANAASEALRASLQIHSPSRVTREMGQMFDQGFLQGILDRAPRIEEETRHISRRAAEGLGERAAVGTSPASVAPAAQPTPVHLTLPLEIDGYRLGVAVIENVNRIRQQTGRVELDL